MYHKSLALISLVVLALLLPASVIATPRQQTSSPTLITYQGYLTSAGGSPIKGTANLKFGVYAAQSGGAPLWAEIHSNVQVADGYFTVLLGSVTALNASIFSATERWLQVSVNTGSGYTDLPRQRISAAPFALQAQEAANADTLDSHDSTYFASTSHAHAGEDITSGTVADARIAATIARSTQITPTVWAHDGAGSGLDADLLDGQHSSAYAPSSHSHPVSGCRVIATTAQSILNQTLTPLSFDTEVNDTANCWSSAVNPERLFARAAGYYMAGGTVAFSDTEINAAGRVSISVRQNGTIYLQANGIHTIAGQALNLSVSTGMFYMNVNDYIEIIIYQNLGGSKNTLPGSMTNQHCVNGWLMKIN